MGEENVRSRLRLAVDIGGTFTDLVLANPDKSWSTKILTTHDAPERAVLEGIDAILRLSGYKPSDIAMFVHGTTLATNALIERKGARTALITTRGFRDSLQIAYEHRFDQYDLNMERPEPLVSRPWRFEIDERIAADGSVLLDLDESSVEKVVERLVAEKIEAVAVCLLHSYQNPAHERRVREILTRHFDAAMISLSCEACPEIREYERCSTTVANAYVLPVMSGYLSRLQSAARDMGCDAPLLLIMSSGGVTTLETARRFPIRLVESGPAGGAIMARRAAAQNAVHQALAFDMGGTTAKITLIDNYQPQHARQFEIDRTARFVKGSGTPVRIPVIDMVEIGAGGGSIARVDRLNRINVGPDSAGSMPGPVCYGRGGANPAVTDADLSLGWLDPVRFAGGYIDLDPGAADAAISQQIADPLGLEISTAAYGVTEMVTETMTAAARTHALENGKSLAQRTMIAFGGAAPLHAVRMAQKLGISRIIVPVGASVGSAFGFLDAPMAYEVVRTRLMSISRFDVAEAQAIFTEMQQEAEAVVRLGVPHAPLMVERVAFMRYRGQGHEIPVVLTDDAFGENGAKVILAAFEDAYRALYSRIIPNLDVEVLSWTLSVSEHVGLPEPAAPVGNTSMAKASAQRQIADPGNGQTVLASIYERDSLDPGAQLAGPAVIVEAGTSVLVPDGWIASINSIGHIVIEWSAQ